MAGRAVLFAIDENDTQRLLAAKRDEALISIIEDVEGRWEEEWLCQLDKAWDGIHRCLTDGELYFENGEYPLNHAILGGKQLYEGEDYIITYVQPAQVKDVAAALPAITKDALRERYSKINRSNYGPSPEQFSDDDFEYVAGEFEELQSFYNKAATAGRAVIFTVDQ